MINGQYRIEQWRYFVEFKLLSVKCKSSRVSSDQSGQGQSQVCEMQHLSLVEKHSEGGSRGGEHVIFGCLVSKSSIFCCFFTTLESYLGHL